MDHDRILSTGMAPVRSGMTLIECMVALVILGGSLIALGNFMGKYAHTVSTSANEQTALDLAANRADSARFDSVYLDIPTDFAGTQTFNYGSGATSAKWKRTTTVTHKGGSPTDTIDVMYVTVVVQAPDSGSTVTKTVVIPAF
jgi:prepilin-type N-terminal cleavage/methylation domain-containing protein